MNFAALGKLPAGLLQSEHVRLVQRPNVYRRTQITRDRISQEMTDRKHVRNFSQKNTASIYYLEFSKYCFVIISLCRSRVETHIV